MLSVLGTLGSFWYGARRRAAEQAAAGSASSHEIRRWLLTFVALAGYQVACLALLPQLNGRQQNAFISLFWTFLYMALGAWIGWRLFAIGVVASALILAGYWYLPAHFFLYMGCVTGGALVAGGLWLRRA